MAKNLLKLPNKKSQVPQLVLMMFEERALCVNRRIPHGKLDDLKTSDWRDWALTETDENEKQVRRLPTCWLAGPAPRREEDTDTGEGRHTGNTDS